MAAAPGYAAPPLAQPLEEAEIVKQVLERAPSWTTMPSSRDPLATVLGRIVEADRVDQRESRRRVLEIQLDLQPIVTARRRWLDRAIDAGTREVTPAAG